MKVKTRGLPLQAKKCQSRPENHRDTEQILPDSRQNQPANTLVLEF